MRRGPNWTALEVIFVSEYVVVTNGVRATIKNFSILTTTALRVHLLYEKTKEKKVSVAQWFRNSIGSLLSKEKRLCFILLCWLKVR